MAYLHLATFDPISIIELIVLIVLVVLLAVEILKARGFSMNVLYILIALVVFAVIFLLLF